jgi:hypothetical protein
LHVDALVLVAQFLDDALAHRPCELAHADVAEFRQDVQAERLAARLRELGVVPKSV